MKRALYVLMLPALTFWCGCSGGGEKEKDNGRITVVMPTTVPGSASDDVSLMQLRPGKLISLTQVNSANCQRAINAGMSVDIMFSDNTVFAEGLTDLQLEGLISEAGSVLNSSKAMIWGIHLPYRTYDISAVNEASRTLACGKLKRLMELSMKYIKPKHFVIHGSTGSILSAAADFPDRTAQSRKTIKELQACLASCNTAYSANTILCVENCPRSVAYDAPSTLALLTGEGLEDVRICLDTGHALIPLSGEYVDPVKNGDAVEFLKAVGTRLGTLHIQQNHGAVGRSGTLDTHLQPFGGGLVDWGEFYYELLKNNRYRGCFLYEVSFTDSFDGTPATIETARANYTELVYPAFRQKLSQL